MNVIYFGCGERDLGHYWFGPGSSLHLRQGEGRPSFEIDGRFAPRDENGKEQPQGIWRCTVIDNWTICAWWDRSVDRRPESNAAFCVRGLHDPNAVVAHGQRLYPGLATRIALLPETYVTGSYTAAIAALAAHAAGATDNKETKR